VNDTAPDLRRAAWLKQAREWLVVIVSAVFIAMALRAFVVQQFYIAGPSMEVTLFGDDRVLVNKLSYRFGSPSRGDVIVFDRITLNGDTVQGKLQQGGLIKRLIDAGQPPEAIIDEIYRRSLTRLPTEKEKGAMLAIVREDQNPQQALEDGFWAILNSREFVFNH
jgi:signal peptidase I